MKREMMNYSNAQAKIKEKYPPTAGYFHNYLFPHNEKRCYRNKLTLIDENVIYLGVTLKDKTNRHWIPIAPVIIQTDNWPKIGNNTPVGYKHFYEHNGLQVSFKRPKLRSYFTNLLNCLGEVKYLGIKAIEPVIPPKPKPKPKAKRISKYEVYRRQFDVLPAEDQYCCYCETELSRMSTTREHLVPTSRGGKGSDYGHDNIKPCCVSCNGEKGNLMLHSYIQLLNYKMGDAKTGSNEWVKLQTKIRNANRLVMYINPPAAH